MQMTIRQLSDLVEGDVVAETPYTDAEPNDVLGVLRLVLRNCSDFLTEEGITLQQDSINLEKLEFTYPGVAGRLQVLFGE